MSSPYSSQLFLISFYLTPSIPGDFPFEQILWKKSKLKLHHNIPINKSNNNNSNNNDNNNNNNNNNNDNDNNNNNNNNKRRIM